MVKINFLIIYLSFTKKDKFTFSFTLIITWESFLLLNPEKLRVCINSRAVVTTLPKHPLNLKFFNLKIRAIYPNFFVENPKI